MTHTEINLVAVVSNVFNIFPFFAGIGIASISLQGCTLAKRIDVSCANVPSADVPVNCNFIGSDVFSFIFTEEVTTAN